MQKFTRRQFAVSAAAVSAAAGLGLRPSFAQANYPTRPITIVCPWGAGGGTDATARIVAAVLEKELGQPVNVVNRTGGSGVVGHSAIATAQPDGYTLGIITVEISMMHWQGLTELTPRSYTPLALMNEDPPGIQVKADSPYKTIKDLADAIKASPPGKMKCSGTGQGGIWHLALVGWLTAMGLKPTLKGAMGIDYSTGAWRGFAGPKGLPQPIADKMTASLKRVYDSKDYKDFMSSRGFGTVWGGAKEFAAFMDKGDAQMGAAMKAAGLAKA